MRPTAFVSTLAAALLVPVLAWADAGAVCDGYPACGKACTNAANPVCCPNGLIAPTDSDCDVGSDKACAVGVTKQASPSSLVPLGAVALVGVVAGARRRRR